MRPVTTRMVPAVRTPARRRPRQTRKPNRVFAAGHARRTRRPAAGKYHEPIVRAVRVARRTSRPRRHLGCHGGPGSGPASRSRRLPKPLTSEDTQPWLTASGMHQSPSQWSGAPAGESERGREGGREGEREKEREREREREKTIHRARQHPPAARSAPPPRLTQASAGRCPSCSARAGASADRRAGHAPFRSEPFARRRWPSRCTRGSLPSADRALGMRPRRGHYPTGVQRGAARHH